MAYKEPEFTKNGASALIRALSGANANIVKRHKAPAKKTTKSAKKKK